MNRTADMTEVATPARRTAKNTKAVDTAPPDRRLIVEKGGYRPDVGGPTLPPMRRSAKPSGPQPASDTVAKN